MKITGEKYLQMIRGGVAAMRTHRTEVNDLNVFPVPDGDTGDNMLMTIEGALGVTASRERAEVSAEANSVAREGVAKPLSEVAREVADAMLLAARGNSGVILSQIFKGMADGLANYAEAGVTGFEHAMREGARSAFAAVAQPVEGTMLTVLRDAVERTGERWGAESSSGGALTSGSAGNSASDPASAVGGSDEIEAYLRILVVEMRLALERTPMQMKLLAESGVVDSGGAGLYYIFEGMLNGGENGETGVVENRAVNLSLFTENSELEYGYCTECLLRLQTVKTEIENFDLDGLKNRLSTLGDSLVVFQNGSIVKIHVHTRKPGEVLNFCQQFGEFLTLKIENMTLQHNRKEHEGGATGGFVGGAGGFNAGGPAGGAGVSGFTGGVGDFGSLIKKTPKKYGLVVAASGEGVKKTFKELGCDAVIDGGRSMNPSTEDFLAAFRECNAKNIFVFPNNKNTIMTANQAAEIFSKQADVMVVATRDVGQGYGAISMYDPSSDEPEAIFKELAEAAEATRTGFVARASRTTEVNGEKVQEGEYFGFAGEMATESRSDKHEVLLELAEKMDVKNADVVVLVKGLTKPFTEAKNDGFLEDLKNDEDGTGAADDGILEKLEARFPGVEFIEIDGGQPIYEYILIIE